VLAFIPQSKLVEEAVMYQNTNVRVMRENPYVRPLENARRVAGGDEQLAAALRTSTQALSRWLSGEVPPPMKTYMAALHLVGRSSLKSRTT
jgi:transcriptional regulator with XRE-family HTH domain